MSIKWLKGRFNKNKGHEEDNIETIRKCEVLYIPCDKIRPNALRSRSNFNEDDLVALAYSIKKYGIIEPICVRSTDEEDSYDYEIIAGERRLRAARLAELYAVPCIIVDADDRFSAEISLIENLYHENLDCFEVAFALKRITELSESSFESLACRLNMPAEDIIKKLYLLELRFEERQLLIERGASEDVCSEIGKISDLKRRDELMKLISKSDAYGDAICSYIEPSCEYRSSTRDISAFIRGVRRKLSFFDRRGKSADMKISENDDSVLITIQISR